MQNSYYPFVDIRMIQTFQKYERAVQWKLDPLFRGLAPFNFFVEVSETLDFSTLRYTLPAAAEFYAVDTTGDVQGKSVHLYYRVRLETGDDKVYYSSAVIHRSQKEKARQYFLAKEIMRREYVRFKYTGQAGWLLKRKNYGERDPADLDPITGAPLHENTGSVGTGFIGGYYKPIPMTYGRESVDSSMELSREGFGTSSQEIQKHRIVGFPMVEPYDVMVADNNERYRYTKVSPVYMPGTDIVLVQMCDCALLPPTDPVYSISI